MNEEALDKVRLNIRKLRAMYFLASKFRDKYAIRPSGNAVYLLEISTFGSKTVEVVQYTDLFE